MSDVPVEIERVFEAVRRAHWLMQVADYVEDEHGLDELPRRELWRAVADRLDAARVAVDEVVFKKEVAA